MTDANDARFQYEIIRGLADSVREQTSALREFQQQLTEISERLARVESNRTHEDIGALRQQIKDEAARIDALMRDKDRRDGAFGAWSWLQRSAPWAVIAGGAAAVIAWLKT